MYFARRTVLKRDRIICVLGILIVLAVDNMYANGVYACCKRVLVCGSRGVSRVNTLLVFQELNMMLPGTTIVHGACRGADLLAAEIALKLGLRVEAHRAEWDRLGKRAGPIRNSKMLASGVDLVLAFWDGVSGGTADTMRKARTLGIPVRVVEIGL